MSASNSSPAVSAILSKVTDRVHELDQQRYYGHAPLGMIKYDETIRNYRIAKSYKPAQLESLRKSLVAKGKLNLLNPLHTIMDKTAGVLRTIGGNRRLASLIALTEKDNSGLSTLTSATLVPVYIYDTEERRDALRKAMMDNAFRRDFTDYERLTAIEDMDRSEMTTADIASSMSTSTDTIDRFLAIARHATLREFLQEGTLPYSKLAQLGKCIEKGDKVSEWITEILVAWKETAEEQKKIYEKSCKRNGKKAVAARLKLQSYLRGATWNCWTEALAAGKKPREQDVKEKKINFGLAGNFLTIDGVKRDLTQASVGQLVDDMLALKHATKVLESALARVKAGETKASDFRESKEYLTEYEKLAGTKPDVELPSPPDETSQTPTAPPAPAKAMAATKPTKVAVGDNAQPEGDSSMKPEDDNMENAEDDSNGGSNDETDSEEDSDPDLELEPDPESNPDLENAASDQDATSNGNGE